MSQSSSQQATHSYICQRQHIHSLSIYLLGNVHKSVQNNVQLSQSGQ